MPKTIDINSLFVRIVLVFMDGIGALAAAIIAYMLAKTQIKHDSVWLLIGALLLGIYLVNL